jgi:hypothetical protein
MGWIIAASVAWLIITGAATYYIYADGFTGNPPGMLDITFVCATYTWMVVGVMPVMIIAGPTLARSAVMG